VRSGARRAAAARPQCPSQRTREVDDARTPALGDGVVEPEDGAVTDGLDSAPTRTAGDRRPRLPAALRVGKDDQARVGRDDVLGRELRVPGAGVGAVGDVPQAEEAVDRARERPRGSRVEVRIHLVVDGAPTGACARRRGEARDPRAHAGDERARAGAAAGRQTELADLRVRRREGPCRQLEQDGDVQAPQRGHEPVGVEAGHHEVGAVAGDRLCVRREAGELRPRRAARKVGLIVDGDHLATGADGEQRLRRRRRERDDAARLLADRDLARGRAQCDRKAVATRGRESS
jgi:hypothetical protein